MQQIYRTQKHYTNPIEAAGRPIWESLFKASVAFKDTVSEDYLRLFGMPTVGDSGLDGQMHNQQIDTYLTINKMIEYFKIGVTVRITVHADTKQIYDIISNYLNCWKENLDRGVNIGGAPIDDLILLDRFAAVVFEHAVQHFTPDYVNSRLINQMNGGGLWKSRDALLKPAEAPLDEVQPFKKHESLAQLFSERVIRSGENGGSRWK